MESSFLKETLQHYRLDHVFGNISACQERMNSKFINVFKGFILILFKGTLQSQHVSHAHTKTKKDVG